MSDLALQPKSGNTVVKLLDSAGLHPSSILKGDRSFASRWAWEDGQVAVITIWVEEIDVTSGTPTWRKAAPAVRDDLAEDAQRRRKAIEVYRILTKYVGKSVRVILQRKAGGSSTPRSLDPEPWFPRIEGSAALLQRGLPPSARQTSMTGEPMTQRPATFALVETRPEQVRFREIVAVKTSHRCALTDVPSELCDAAHFPWADWRTDNQAHHGLLLRRDLHAALDCGLLDIDPNGLVAISAYLGTVSGDYAALHGRRVPV